MIKKNIVLVLGAGSSAPYGFPTGARLTEEICAAFGHQEQVDFFAPLDLPVTAKEVVANLQRSRSASIDSYLSRKPQEEIETGKLMLAYQLAKYEKDDQIFRFGIEDDWYSYLWQRMLDECGTPEQFQTANKIRAITFNYDRSLEHFLTTAIVSTFTFERYQANRFLRHTVCPMHMYGQLGGYRANEVCEVSRRYEPIETIAALQLAARRIEIIPEARDDSPTFDYARKLLLAADQIGFLGFGFDTKNVQRLNLAQVLREKSDAGLPLPRVICTAFQRTKKETVDIQKRLTEGIGSIEFFDARNVDALRESGLLLDVD